MKLQTASFNKHAKDDRSDGELMYRSKRDGSLHRTVDAVRTHHADLDRRNAILAAQGKSPAQIKSYEQNIKKLNSDLSGLSLQEMCAKLSRKGAQV